MPKFSSKQKRANVRSAVRTTGRGKSTYEGGTGYSRDAQSDLFLLAVSNMVGEQTFYESANVRDERFRELVHIVTRQDPDWVRGFIPYLREKMFMRSASVVAAAEYVDAHGPNGRGVVASALKRPDEPAEMLAYWHQLHGRAEPKPIKRGVADAVVRMYSETAALKYDGKGKAWRMGDVIERVHPKPRDARQGQLFRWLLDVRHHTDENTPSEQLEVLRNYFDWVNNGALIPADGGLPTGVTWETLSTYHKMDKAAWEAVIPQMGYMALLRNLRNFEAAGVDRDVLAAIGDKLRDPNEVAKSKQFPIRFYSAYKANMSLTYGLTLEDALEHSVKNIPQLKGSTLVMVDVSGSMDSPISARSSIAQWEIASLFGAALAKRAEKADLIAYSDTWTKVPIGPQHSVLRVVERIGKHHHGGTRTIQAVASNYNGHDRVVILTDEQAFASSYVGWANEPKADALAHIPLIYTFNLAGYDRAHLPSGEKGRYTFGGGLSDAAFSMLAVLEEQREGRWPWEAS
jgi:TROVE domain-containing protein